jgi:adenine-specific DNA-methyltransferase
LVLFTERVFPGVLEEIVLVLADGFGETSARDLEIRQARNLDDLDQAVASSWIPPSVEAKWTPSLISPAAVRAYEKLADGGAFSTLQTWGETTLGMVTGNNRYFTLTRQAVRELGLQPREVLRLSPPGSRHLRGLDITTAAWNELCAVGKAVYLFRPPKDPSPQARLFIQQGEAVGVHKAYKCKVRKPWWRVPLVRPADLLLTYMNADTARLCTNTAGVHNLNSVHGFYLHDEHCDLGKALLSLASLNSMTFLSAEAVGRAYGGGMLKLEPKEADRLLVPSPELLQAACSDLNHLRPQVQGLLRKGDLMTAARMVDDVLLVEHIGLRRAQISALRDAHEELYQRRLARGADPRVTSR